jgi:hypothetical protein
MKTTNIIKTAVWMALLAGMSVAGIKYVAVVESDIDEGSGASKKVSRADVRLVTAELRREAVKNLPPKKYVIMTAETVMAQGGAVLEECAEENCVITLGSKIGADYIVRGTVSKLESKFTLQVEMYETNDGTLVASCDPVRSESISELVEKAAEACANMFKTWLAAQASEPASQQAVESGRTKHYIGANGTLIKSSSIDIDSGDWTQREWATIEFGWLTSYGLFYGVEFGTGSYGDFNFTINLSFNEGYTFNLPADFALSVGGSAGIWYETTTSYDSYNDCMGIGFGGPFVKARWKFIEISYRGIIENWVVSDLFEGGWRWINQVKAGLYFEF